MKRFNYNKKNANTLSSKAFQVLGLSIMTAKMKK